MTYRVFLNRLLRALALSGCLSSCAPPVALPGANRDSHQPEHARRASADGAGDQNRTIFESRVGAFLAEQPDAAWSEQTQQSLLDALAVQSSRADQPCSAPVRARVACWTTMCRIEVRPTEGDACTPQDVVLNALRGANWAGAFQGSQVPAEDGGADSLAWILLRPGRRWP